MRVPKQYSGNLKHVVSKEESRYTLNCPWFYAEKQLIAATDGRALVIIPVIAEPDEVDGPVPMVLLAAYQRAYEKHTRKPIRNAVAPSLELKERATLTLPDGTTTSKPRDFKATFPKWETLIIPPAEGTSSITLNAELLAGIQRSFGSEGVKIWIENHDKSIRVTPSGHRKVGVGVLMPMRGSEAIPFGTVEGLERA